jgi:hypothetical protein
MWSNGIFALEFCVISNKTLGLDPALYDCLLSVSLRESDLLKQLRAETAAHPWSRMQIAPEQGQFMSLLVELMGVAKALEIGVFTGYSSLSAGIYQFGADRRWLNFDEKKGCIILRFLWLSVHTICRKNAKE